MSIGEQVTDVHEVEPVLVQDVNVVNSEVLQPKGRRVPVPSNQPSLAPRTTLEDDIRTAAQRDLNMTWENTQALISKIVVITTCSGVIISLLARAFWPETLIAFPSEWWAIVGLVIGFYFGRTNHARSTASATQGGLFNTNTLDDR